jgi:hypothetical protein
MTMTPRVRKLALVTHVACSVGWLGAVITSLAVATVPLVTRDGELVRGAYLTLEPIGWYALIPLSVVSLVTGLIQSLGTTWGLLRHYWVTAKLLMNLLATGVLLLYMQVLTYLADSARTARSVTDLTAVRTPSPVAHAAAAVVLLVVALVLSIYKPRGLTRYGQRKLRQRQPSLPQLAGLAAGDGGT